MNERLQSPEQCSNVKTLGAAACAQCFADCPLAQLARAPKETTANVQAGNAEAATRALFDDRVEAVSADFGGGYAAIEGTNYTKSVKMLPDVEKQIREAKVRAAQKKAEEEARVRSEREAKARETAQKAADASIQSRQQQAKRAEAQRAADKAKQPKKPALKPTLIEQFSHDLAKMFSVR